MAKWRHDKTESRYHLMDRRLALVLALVPLTVLAQSEELTCPPADKVGLVARTPEWMSADTLYYPFEAPKHRLERMRWNALGGPECWYRVDGGGLLRIYKYGKCEAGRGTWRAMGNTLSCESTNPNDCSLRCTPQ
jgi:hypothetical protein